MSVDPYMERVQRRVLDDAGHEDVPVEWTTITDAFRFPNDVLPEGLPIWDELVYERYRQQHANDRAIVEALLGITPAPVSSPRPSLWQRTPEWAIWLGTAALIVALLALPVVFS